MKRFPNIQMLLIGAVALALGAAAIPVALGIYLVTRSGRAAG